MALAGLTACGGKDSATPTTTSTSTSTSTTAPAPSPAESTTEQVTQSAAPAVATEGSCEVEAFHDIASTEVDTVTYCDGRSAKVGKYATDMVLYAHFVHGKWSIIEPDGQSFTGFSCYDIAKLDSQGVPAVITDQMTPCVDWDLPGTECKTYGEHTLVVKMGEIACPEAIRVMDYYIAHKAEAGGNHQLLNFDDWWCSSPTAATFQATGEVRQCDSKGGAKIALMA